MKVILLKVVVVDFQNTVIPYFYRTSLNEKPNIWHPTVTHSDFVQARSTSVRTLSHFHCSATISLEYNTQLLVGKFRIPVCIPLHAMLFFRGDMPHAGAGYPLGNSRLFLSASSNTFPVTYDVYLVK
jgi:hypothetical protein